MNKKVEDLLFYLSWRVVNSPFFLAQMGKNPNAVCY